MYSCQKFFDTDADLFALANLLVKLRTAACTTNKARPTVVLHGNVALDWNVLYFPVPSILLSTIYKQSCRLNVSMYSFTNSD